MQSCHHHALLICLSQRYIYSTKITHLSHTFSNKYALPLEPVEVLFNSNLGHYLPWRRAGLCVWNAPCTSYIHRRFSYQNARSRVSPLIIYYQVDRQYRRTGAPHSLTHSISRIAGIFWHPWPCAPTSSRDPFVATLRAVMLRSLDLALTQLECRDLKVQSFKRWSSFLAIFYTPLIVFSCLLLLLPCASRNLLISPFSMNLSHLSTHLQLEQTISQHCLFKNPYSRKRQGNPSICPASVSASPPTPAHSFVLVEREVLW